MASNFAEMIDRRNTASLKWDVEENELPMWVADMDFATAPCVLEAMKNQLESWDFWLYRDSGTGMRHMLAGGKKDIILK